MFDHIGLGVSNYEASKQFFLKALTPLGAKIVMEGAYGLGIGPNGKPSFWLHQASEKPAPLHLAFAAENRAQVDEFYRAALEAGGKDNGAPGLRPHYHANYYGAFVIGPDGHNVEAVCATNQRPNPSIERLPIGCARGQRLMSNVLRQHTNADGHPSETRVRDTRAR